MVKMAVVLMYVFTYLKGGVYDTLLVYNLLISSQKSIKCIKMILQKKKKKTQNRAADF